jgi:hypothetical protein
MSHSGYEPQSTPEGSQHVPSPGYETRDANIGKVVMVGLGLLALSVGSLILMYLLVVWATDPPARLAHPGEERPAGALEDALPSDQEQLRKRQEAIERQVLASYGWIDRDRQIVHVPIERAIELIGRQGQLPSFSTENGGNDERP